MNHPAPEQGARALCTAITLEVRTCPHPCQVLYHPITGGIFTTEGIISMSFLCLVLPGQGPHLGTLEHVYCPVPLSRTAGKSRTVLCRLMEASMTSKTRHNTTFGLWLPVQKTVRLVRNMSCPSSPGKVSSTSQKPLRARGPKEQKALLTNSN